MTEHDKAKLAAEFLRSKGFGCLPSKPVKNLDKVWWVKGTNRRQTRKYMSDAELIEEAKSLGWMEVEGVEEMPYDQLHPDNGRPLNRDGSYRNSREHDEGYY